MRRKDMEKAFLPVPGATVSRTVSGASANVARPAAANGCDAVRITYIAGTDAARVRFGFGSSTAATSADMRIPNPGTPWAYAEAFSINATDNYIAAITDSGTCTIEITFGFGA
jgi:hypothetical protein